jgi:glycosyltransferase involved in cell wall biosynthesis
MTKLRLAIVASHPVQYNAPWFRLLAASQQFDVMVFYTWSQAILDAKFDPGFGRTIEWDIPLLEGYQYTIVENTSLRPGSHHFKGIVNKYLNEEIERWQAQAVLVIGWAFKSHLSCLRYFKNKIPVLFRGDSTFLRRQHPIKAFLRLCWLKWVYRHIDCALYVGVANKQYFKKCGLKDAQLVFAPHAIDNKRFEDTNGYLSHQAIVWRQQLGIAPQELVLLFAGKLEAVKHPFFLLEIASKLQQLPVKVIIAGNGPLEKQLKEKAASMPNVVFLDFQNQQRMPVLYRMANLFVLCSVSETWGLSVNEAMACGVPVLASNTCACTLDLLSNGKAGFTFNFNDASAVVRFVEDMIRDRRKLHQMGTLAREQISRYNFESIVHAVESTLLKSDTSLAIR